MSKTVKKKGKFRRFLKWFLITIVRIVALAYVVVFLGHRVFFKVPESSKPTISVLMDGKYRGDAASHKQSNTNTEYIKVLAQQVGSYNEKVTTLWPNNTEINQYVIAQDIKTNKACLILPKGDVSTLSARELKKYNTDCAFDVHGGWSRFKGNGVEGAFLPVD